MAVTPEIHRIRLQSEYDQMSNLLDGSGIITWKAIKGTPPYVEEYEVTINVRTIIGLQGGTPTYRDSSVVRIMLPPDYPDSKPTARMVSNPQPFHPNWYTNGRWCEGYWARSEFLGDYVIRLTRTLQFSTIISNENSPANPDANRWYEAHKNSGLFPCDRKTLPDPSEKKCRPAARSGFRVIRRG